MNPSVETRSFHYSDNKSDKFWIIMLENNQHTVRYGRAGTQGQQQTKEFSTAEKARQSYEKLIREKVAKGYVETDAQANAQAIATTSVPQVKQASSKATSVNEQTIAELNFPTVSLSGTEHQEAAALNSSPPHASSASLAETYQSPPELGDLGGNAAPRTLLERSINLDPKDWFWAIWRNPTPLQQSNPKPFNLENCLARLRKVTVRYNFWDWSKARIEPVLSREEAHFWFTAIAAPKTSTPKQGEINYLKPEELAEKLSHQSFDGNLTLEQVKDSGWRFSNWSENHAAEIHTLANLLPADEFIELADLEGQTFPALYGFRDYILPYLSVAEIEELRSKFRSRIDPKQWTMTSGSYTQPSSDFFFAAQLGLHDELLPLIESWSDDTFTNPNQTYLAYYQRPQEIIFGLKDPRLVEHHLKRLGLKLQPPYHIRQTSAYVRAWLAHTEYSALDLIRDTVLAAGKKEEAEELLEAFALVIAPEAAPLMLELMLSSKAPQVARRWLNDNPEHAIAGIIPITTGRGKLADAAIEFLRTMKRKGYTSSIETYIENESLEVIARIQSSVLNGEEKEYIPFDSQTTPEWLAQAIATHTTKLNKKTSWTIALADLPPIAVGNYCLNAAQTEAVLNALRESKLDSPHSLILALQKQIDRIATDDFAWKLFELWFAEGAPSKENWAMMAVGLLGSDASALKLAPMIRVWPGESQHQRAVLGLGCLRSIGTDTALMQINGIAQKVAFKGIKQRAQDCMEAIAQDRNMTREQLEDRIVPDFDLDDRGSRLFDFGARQFRFVLGADLKPMVKDADGKVKPNLPNPTAKDDSEKAQAAIADWKLFKKQVSEVIKIQPARLEQAMITGRRWQTGEFETLLVQHPLMTHFIQRLIWGGYDASGKLTATFRVTEDRTCADRNDETFDLTGLAQVGIVHPLHLTSDDRSTWGELLSDYEIIQPFVQVGRSLHSLEPGEETALEITRFKDIKIPIVALVRTLENLGWQRGDLHDHGDYALHYKYFSSADVTAVVGDYETVFVDLSFVGSELEDIDRCCFLRGRHDRLYDYPGHSWMKDVNAKLIPLGEVDPVIISEVLKDLMTVAAKA